MSSPKLISFSSFECHDVKKKKISFPETSKEKKREITQIYNYVLEEIIATDVERWTYQR